MKIAVMSDLHLEGSSYLDDLPEADVLVLAGDIVSAHDSGAVTSKNFYKKVDSAFGANVIEVNGNHDGYGGSTEYFTNEQTCKRIGDTVFIAATLWSGEESRRAYQILNDRNIPGFSWEWMHERHISDLFFIEDCLAKNLGEKTVVVTHHLPSIQCVHTKWLDGDMSLNYGFFTDLDWLLDKYKPDMWIFGHTHDSVNKVHSNGTTKLVCNPRGYRRYSRYENPDFDGNLVVEV